MKRSVKKILQNQFIIPFGRYRLKRSRQSADTPVLVGREGQRAFFVDALTGIGERGAFLITGRRGVGKTTFVENCLHDYRQNVFRRFLGSGVGRSIYDFMLLLLFVLALIAVLLAAGELLTIVTPEALDSPFLFVPLAICVIIAGTPCFIGMRTAHRALSVLVGRYVHFVWLTVMAAMALTIFWIPPFGAPTQGISLVILALGLLFFLGSLLTFKAPLTLGTCVERGGEFGPCQSWTQAKVNIFIFNVLLPFAVVGAASAGAYWFHDQIWAFVHGTFASGTVFDDLNDPSARPKGAFLLAALGCSMILGTMFGHLIALYLISQNKKNRVADEVATGKGAPTKTLLVGLLCFGTLFVLGGLLSAVTWGLAFWCAVAVVVCAAVVGLWRSYRYLGLKVLLFAEYPDDKKAKDSKLDRWQPRFCAPPVEAALIAKSFALILLSAQLLFPVIVPFLDLDRHGAAKSQEAILEVYGPSRCNRYEEVDGQSIKIEKIVPGKPNDDTNSSGPNPNTVPEKIRWNQPLYKSEDRDDSGWACKPLRKKQQFTLFDIQSREAIGWFAAVLLLIICLFFIEYEWINRPFVNQRQPRALDRGPRKPQQMHHHLDPIWFEVSLSRQFDRHKSTFENDPNYHGKTLASLYEPKGRYSGPDDRNSLFARRDTLQRKVLARFRTMEAVTFTNVLTRLWLPVVEVHVNLGFDALDHRGVTHAMLDGLRRAYRRTFVRFWSPYQLIRAFGLTFGIMVSVVLLGRIWFDFPLVSKDVRVEMPLTLPLSEDANGLTGEQGVTGGPRPAFACRYLEEIERRTQQDLLPGEPSNRMVRSLVPETLCMLPSRFAEPVLGLLYTQVIVFELPRVYEAVKDQDSVKYPVFLFVHRNVGTPTLRDGQIIPADRSLSLRVYHFLLMVALFSLFRRLGRRYPILPYQQNLKRIEGLIDQLILRRSDTTNARTGLSVGALFGSLGQSETATGIETSREALDPRSVELKLLALLKDLRGKPDADAPGDVTPLSIPKPDIHFIFDELDKLSGVAGSEFTAHDVDEQDKEAIEFERQRAYRVHRLLSDMKRVISAAPARFIFVGGRSLHDEWIRDQNRLGSTQPLLTSIFDHEIYLPSLLVDHPRARHENALVPSGEQTGKALDLRVREFLVASHQSAHKLERELRVSRYVPWFGLGRMASSAQFFTDHVARMDETFAEFDVIDARVGKRLKDGSGSDAGADGRAGVRDDADAVPLPAPAATLQHLLPCRSTPSSEPPPPPEIERIWKQEFMKTLVGFLAYRSAGSPKKLNELLSEMIRPSGSVQSPEIDKHAVIPQSRDSLVLDEKLVYRAQFINSVFRHIEASFGQDLLQRDDKITINTIFMFDFLMKMHDRAFSWSSIERLDELAHIHRAPDLRRLFDAVVTNSAERYFHKVLNGIFAFRFRSELAIEIRYLSRISQAEMAALNFTLDESQELKTTYSAMLERAGDSNPDLLTALGELYEFDQSYDVARSYYEKALRSMDDEFVRLSGAHLATDDPVGDAISKVLSGPRMGHTAISAEREAILGSDRAGPGPEPFLHAMLGQSSAAKTAVRTNLPWAIRRLRIMLQIGLTFELQADEERAQAQYYACQLFSNVILSVALNGPKDDTAPLAHVLKHLSLVFQPVFASAWIAEKLENGVDTSLSIVERELARLRKSLPFVRVPDATDDKTFASLDNGHAAHDQTMQRDAQSNYVLVVAELHNKAGDLYFFKGRSSYDESGGKFFEKIGVNGAETRQTNTAGYLHRAHFHYALALHEARRFVFYREHMSRRRLNVANFDLGNPATDLPPTQRENTLDTKNLPTFVMQTIYSSIVDLAEVTLARSSLLEAWVELGRDSTQQVGNWLKEPFDIEKFADKTTGSETYAYTCYSDLRGYIDSWFFLSDADTRETAPSTCETTLRRHLGSWRDNIDKAAPGDPIGFGAESSNHQRILLSLFMSLSGVRAVNRANYPDAASFEAQITLEHVNRLLRSARTVLLCGQLAGKSPDNTEAQAVHDRLQRGRAHFGASKSQLDFLSVLIDIGALAAQRASKLKKYAYPEQGAETGKGTKTSDTSSIVAAALIAEFRLLISDLSAFVINDKALPSNSKYLLHWDGHLDALTDLTRQLLGPSLLEEVGVYQLNYTRAQNETGREAHRREARALLIYMVTHHKYPALANMSALKALIDNAVVIDGGLGENAFRYIKDRTDQKSREQIRNRLDEVRLWTEELLNAEKLMDAPMHFPPAAMAETLSLIAMVTPFLEEDMRDRFHDHYPEQARKHRWRAEQAFTMGRQYYQNLSRLIYLFDDLNDRRRHSVHSEQMSMADLLALYRFALDRRG